MSDKAADSWVAKHPLVFGCRVKTTERSAAVGIEWGSSGFWLTRRVVQIAVGPWVLVVGWKRLW